MAAKCLKSTKSTRKTTKAINTSQSTPKRRQTPRKPRTPRTPRTPQNLRNLQPPRNPQLSLQDSTVDQTSPPSNALVAAQENKSPKIPTGASKTPPKVPTKPPSQVKPSEEDQPMHSQMEEDHPVYPAMDSSQESPSSLMDISHSIQQASTEPSPSSTTPISPIQVQQDQAPTSDCKVERPRSTEEA